MHVPLVGAGVSDGVADPLELQAHNPADSVMITAAFALVIIREE